MYLIDHDLARSYVDQRITEAGQAARAKRTGRDIEAHIVDQLFLPRGFVHGGAAFKQQRSDTAIAERA